MKKIKYIIILLVIIIVLALVMLIILKKNPDIIGDNNLQVDTQGDVGAEPEITGKEGTVEDNSKIKTVENCIQKYYDMINIDSDIYYGQNDNGDFEKIVEDEEINENILKLLSNEYINENNIKASNLDNYVEKIDEKAMVISLQMKEIINDTSERFAVYGIIINLDYKILDDFYIYVDLDISNRTFALELANNQYNSFDEMSIIDKNITIEKNDYNNYQSVAMGQEETAKELISRFKKLALSSPRFSYNYLNEEYRNNKFGNVEEYQNYIQENYDNIKTLNLSKYRAEFKDEYEEIVCLDQNNKYYIFNEKSLLNFNMFLDTYTIATEDFIEQYNAGNEQVKVGMNVNKILRALNDKDYKYIYSKLDETFKARFGDFNGFKQYMSNRYPSSYENEYNNFEDIGNNIYTQKVNLTDITNSEETTDLSIVMRLDEGTDFTMSFEI